MCDVPLCENTTPLNALNEHYEIVVHFLTMIILQVMTISPYGEDIDYVDASPPDVEIVSLEVVEIVDPEVGKELIDALRDNPTSEVVIKSTSTFPDLFLEEANTFDNSIPESETFRFNLEEISSGSPHSLITDLSLPV
ncbi:hypothetical protein Tco_1578734 [Tanacetum coccineum]